MSSTAINQSGCYYFVDARFNSNVAFVFSSSCVWLIYWLYGVLRRKIMREMINVCVMGSIIECNTLIWENPGSEGGGLEHPVLKKLENSSWISPSKLSKRSLWICLSIFIEWCTHWFKNPVTQPLGTICAYSTDKFCPTWKKVTFGS